MGRHTGVFYNEVFGLVITVFIFRLRTYGSFISKEAGIFCLAVPRHSIEDSFCVPERFSYRKKIRDSKKGGYHDFPSKGFCLTAPKQFVKGVSEKTFPNKREGGSITFFRRKFFVYKTKKKSKGNTFEFRKNSAFEKFERKDARCRLSRFPVENFLSHRTCSKKNSSAFSISLLSQKNNDTRGGGYHDFPSKLFCVTVPEHFVENPSTF